MVRRFVFGVIFTAVLLLQGCGGKGVLVEKSFEGGCWTLQDTLEATFDNTDTTLIYTLWFPIFITDDYPYNNLYLHALLIPPSGEPTMIPSRFPLQNPSGEWNSESKGDEVEFNLLLSEGLRFNQVGQYRIRLYHYMQDEKLCGVARAGISLEEAKKAQ